MDTSTLRKSWTRPSTSPYYRQEYWGEYKGEKGNLFPQSILDYAAGLTDELIIKDTMTGEIRRTIQRPPKELTVQDVISDYRFLGPNYRTSVGTDPAFNSSMFASVVNKEIAGHIYAVKEAEIQAPIIRTGYGDAEAFDIPGLSINASQAMDRLISRAVHWITKEGYRRGCGLPQHVILTC